MSERACRGSYECLEDILSTSALPLWAGNGNSKTGVLDIVAIFSPLLVPNPILYGNPIRLLFHGPNQSKPSQHHERVH